MIAHVAFDLPLEAPFDYLIPEEMLTKVMPGVRVKVVLGAKPMTGFVIGIAAHASVAKVKPLKAVCDEQPVFDARDLTFARVFAQYYGCSLGEALAMMMRHRAYQPSPLNAVPAVSRPDSRLRPTVPPTLYHCPDGQYAPVIERLTQGRDDYFIIVPDAFTASNLLLSSAQRSHVGLRSAMFEAFTHCGLIIMVDEDSASYKQEQSPMYEARQAVLMARTIYGFDAAFIGSVPSVELMRMAGMKTVDYEICKARALSRPVIIDTGNYKFLEKGILSPAARHAVQENITAQRQTLIILNRRGSYSITRCADCGHIFKCRYCDSPMSYSRAQKQFICRHCAYHADAAADCPQCGKTAWKSFGMGVEQLQKELSMLFPTVIMAHFDKDSTQLPGRFDILIATSAVLRCKGQLNPRTVLLVDLDAELNRLDMRSSFKGWALAQHARFLGEHILIQTRNPGHHVLKALAADDSSLFYKEELRLRQELGFAPFRHWAAVIIRAKVEKSAQTCAQDMYNALNKDKPEGIDVSSPGPDVPAKLRDQYRFRVLVQGKEVEPMTALIKQALAKIKRSRVIITLNIDP